MSLLPWKALPKELHEAVETRLGASIKSTVDSRGHGPHDYSGAVFTDLNKAYVVAVERGNRAGSQSLMHEFHANQFQDGVAPRCLWKFESLTWTVAGFEYLTGERPDLGPGSPDLPTVVQLLNDLTEPGASFVRPDDEANFCYANAFESLASRLAHESAWRTLVTNSPRVLHPWERGRTKQLVDYELLLFDVLSGGLYAVHTDISAASVLLTNSGPRLTGWHNVAKAPRWVDPAVFAVHLVAHGHSPEGADELMAQVPAWKQASCASIDAFAASLLGRWILGGRSEVLKRAARRYVVYRLARTE